MNREFTVSVWLKVFCGFFALLMIGGAVFGIVQSRGEDVAWIMAIFLVPIGVFIFTSVAQRRIVITDTTLTNTNIFKTIELQIADIKGVRFNQKTVVIESLSGKKISIGSCGDYADGSELKDWLLANFTDLNADEGATELNAVLNDISLGYTVEDRKAKLDRAKYIAIGYSIGGGIIGALGFISLATSGGDAPFILVALIYPLLGALVIATSNGLIRIITKKASPYYHIIIGIEFPAIMLMAVGLSRGNILQYDNFVLFATIVLLAFMLLFYFADHASNNTDIKGKIIILLIFGAMYGAGAVASVNDVFDRSEVQQYSATVLDKYVRHGKSTSYNLQISGWGQQLKVRTVSVSRTLYNQKSIGESVSVYLHKGFLSIPWYTVSQ
ncbi:hypothetical protein BEL04_07265 [Mucilaginibacter sp. PPCGB 2223]|uniref:hypothetical protein n=1 Tax=Mucilaginibacter sp. PPCGB 2223 TaxID=1886027 RepID=UPI000825794D|nr:hypothetical protein [Mucilaginibacter sp. PPCGB 2223]OCX54065.1 hypothetical protein BEL04_07265 [Mucilaginibacter sp. PPCGB 2223]